ncbi:MAG TPA: phosphotransferase family protein, partial [Hyphomicrobiaceae bacterium]|nr:phosphotransferase family protein [Hyphomicrobiaceae bacterium]
MAGIDEPLAAVLRRRIAGCRDLIACERLSAGASQETYRIVISTDAGERKLAMRRAPGAATSRHGGYPGLATEALLLAAARRAGVPEPEILWVLRPEDGLGDGFIMDWLEGETLGARIVRDASLAAIRPKLAEQCGEILARIHAIDLDATSLRARLEHLSPEQSVRATWQRYQALDTPQPMIDFTARWLLEHLPASVEPRLVHSDFRNGNIMVSVDGIVAVLDWEIAHIGDPMRDLGWLCTNSWRFGRSELAVGGFGAYADLVRGYQRVSGKGVAAEHVRFWEIFGSFWWACSSLSMAQHYRTGPDRTVERPAIGRRSSECQVDCVNLLLPGPVALLAPAAVPASVDMPRIDEIVTSVRDYLRHDVMAATKARTQFLARVAGNALDIVLRDLAVGPEHRRRQVERLRLLLGEDGDLEALRRALVQRLREDRMALDHPGLADYLREAVVNQVAIDQPTYSGFKTALANAGIPSA